MIFWFAVRSHFTDCLLIDFVLVSARSQDVFLTVRRKKTTIFIDAKESWTVLQLKKAIEGILKFAPESQQLYKDDALLDDSKSLSESGFTSASSKAQAPATVGLAVKGTSCSSKFCNFSLESHVDIALSWLPIIIVFLVRVAG